jgi:hypothetical protein
LRLRASGKRNCSVVFVSDGGEGRNASVPRGTPPGVCFIVDVG